MLYLLNYIQFKEYMLRVEYISENTKSHINIGLIKFDCKTFNIHV